MEEPVRIEQCNNVNDFRSMARRRLPGPIFHYIDGAADDEITYRRNTEAHEQCDLVPNVLAGVESIDMSTTVMGQKLRMPLFCSPTALQRLFHRQSCPEIWHHGHPARAVVAVDRGRPAPDGEMGQGGDRRAGARPSRPLFCRNRPCHMPDNSLC
jgi:hypothetical protein